jgi:methionine-rich copper-binding protein CopC
MIFSLNTSDSLASNTTYTCTVGTGAQDLNGNALTAAYQWSFSTGSNSDIAPTVIPALDVPSANATAVAVLPAISVTFSEAMDETSAQTAFSMVDASANKVTGTFSNPWTGNTMTFTPTASLANGMTYTCTVGTGATGSVLVGGNPMAAAYSWSFKTLLLAPTIVTGSESPLNSAINVAVSTQISVTFSEPMDTSSLAASMNPTVDGTFAWSGGNTIITFTPTYNLANNTMYTCTVTTAKNTQGTPLAGTYTWSFTTVAAP